jgi:protoporphyrinogen oxidase
MAMKVAVIGGGVLGLTLAHRAQRAGHQVELFEAAPDLGGLAAPQKYAPFVWDRYYHCILPQDTALIGLLEELGLGGELRWAKTGTGYYSGGRFYSMSGVPDYIRFPLLSVTDKARLGLTILHAMRTAKPHDLYRITAAEWLTRWGGRRVYENFWRPLLRAKFGTHHDQVAAVFIWATLTRLQGARRGAGARENLGYVSGGYAKILGTFRERLEQGGARVRTSAPVEQIQKEGEQASVRWGGSEAGQATFDQVFFTGPTRLARKTVQGELSKVVELAEQRYPTSSAYLGVACLNLVLKRPLTPYYVLNIADEKVELTGLIEMTNLIDRATETAGHSLVYLPRYMDSADASFDAPPERLTETLLGGARRLFPGLSDSDIVDRQLHRTRLVQPLPLVRQAAVGAEPPVLTRPFTLLNTTMLECATLNNNEVVALVDRTFKRWYGPAGN